MLPNPDNETLNDAFTSYLKWYDQLMQYWQAYFWDMIIYGYTVTDEDGRRVDPSDGPL